MKKSGQHILMRLNIVLICALFLLSGILFVLSNNSQFFGYSIALESQNDRQNLLIADKHTAPVLNQRVLIRSSDDKVLSLFVVKTDKDAVIVSDEAGNEQTISLSSPLYLGKIVAQNAFWGHAFYAIAAPQNAMFTFFIIGAGFLICIILLLLIYILQGRKEIMEQEKEISRLDEESKEHASKFHFQPDAPLPVSFEPKELITKPILAAESADSSIQKTNDTIEKAEKPQIAVPTPSIPSVSNEPKKVSDSVRQKQPIRNIKDPTIDELLWDIQKQIVTNPKPPKKDS